MKNCYVSIIITTYNRGEFLQDILESIACQTYPSEFIEVIVVSDGEDHHNRQISMRSTECFSERLPYPKGPQILYIWRPKIGYDPGGCRNIGMQSARGDIIIINDDDCLFDKKCIEEHLKWHDTGNAVIYGKVIDTKLSLTEESRRLIVSLYSSSLSLETSKREALARAFEAPEVNYLESVFKDMSYSYLINFIKHSTRIFKISKELEIAKRFTGKNLSFKKTSALAIGGFDKTFSGKYGYQDSDFARRLVGNGCIPIFDTFAIAYFIRPEYHYSFEQREIDKEYTNSLVKSRDYRKDIIQNKGVRIFG